MARVLVCDGARSFEAFDRETPTRFFSDGSGRVSGAQSARTLPEITKSAPKPSDPAVCAVGLAQRRSQMPFARLLSPWFLGVADLPAKAFHAAQRAFLGGFLGRLSGKRGCASEEGRSGQ